MTAEEFDQRFERGESVTELLDFERASRPRLQARRVHVDFPEWMITALDQQAGRFGVTRQSIIKLWIADRLKAEEPR